MLDERPHLVNAVDNPSSGMTPLMWAANRTNRLEVLRLLLDRGADINAVDRGGRTALHFAVSMARADLSYFKLLMERGADVTLGYESVLRTCAHQGGEAEIVRSLLRANSTPEYLNGRNGTEGETALITACRGGRLTAATVLLLEAGADYTIRSNRGETALQAALGTHRLQCAELIKNYRSYLEQPYVLYKARRVHDDRNERERHPDKPLPTYLAADRAMLPEVPLGADAEQQTGEGGTAASASQNDSPVEGVPEAGPPAASTTTAENYNATTPAATSSIITAVAAASTSTSSTATAASASSSSVSTTEEGAEDVAQSDVGSGGQQQATSLPPAVSHLGKRRQEGSDGGSIGKEAKEEEGHDEEEERDEEREAVAVFLVKVLSTELFRELMDGLRLPGERWLLEALAEGGEAAVAVNDVDGVLTRAREVYEEKEESEEEDEEEGPAVQVDEGGDY